MDSLHSYLEVGRQWRWPVCRLVVSECYDALSNAHFFRGIFTPASMFNDLGFTLTPDSMVSFQMAVVPLLLGSFLIVIGNTGFPCMLRVIIWAASKMTHQGTGIWEEYRFLLDHPRRCFTLLFPGTATWWLFWILVVLNGLDLIFFIVLDVSPHTLISARVSADIEYSFTARSRTTSIRQAIGCSMASSKPPVPERRASPL